MSNSVLERCSQETVTLDEEIMEAGKSSRGGWSKKQIKLLVVIWPPPRGWKTAVIGKQYPGEQIRRFVELKDKHFRFVPGDRTSQEPMECCNCEAVKPGGSFVAKSGRVTKVCYECRHSPMKPRRARVKRNERREKRRSDREIKYTIGGHSYRSRDFILRELGFATYKEYLASDLWKTIRRRVYADKGSNCSCCGERATELHHNRYHKNDLLGEHLKFIYPICRRCHEEIEFRGDRKASVKQAARVFAKLMKRHSGISPSEDRQRTIQSRP